MLNHKPCRYFLFGCLLQLGRMFAADGDMLCQIDSTSDWEGSGETHEGLMFSDNLVHLKDKEGFYRSKVHPLEAGQQLASITVTQAPVWENWTATGKVIPSNLRDAPVFLALSPGNYWVFGRYREAKDKTFLAEDASLEGYDIPLKTTPFPNQFDAPGGLKKSLGGYHAWQSKDMVNWVHHGPVSDKRARWVTTAEAVDGKIYIYYDFPNDQDPHLLIDEDLTDGQPGKDMGMAFKDPSDGSDCTVIRGRDGRFHLVYEDWSPINARKHSWDSPLAGHAVSKDGISGFEILDPAVDERTKPTGEFKRFEHPHWHRDDPENYPVEEGRKRAVSRYEVHKPEQDAYGDWASITIGEQVYLFGDFHPAGTSDRSDMQIAWFTSPNLGEPFKFCSSIGSGHPDPDIGFAEGQFYLINQTKQDYVSPGPWVEKVELRVGVDTTGNGEPDVWSDWQQMKETYSQVKGFAKQINRQPATLDLRQLPKGRGVCFELKVQDATDNASSPLLDAVMIRVKD